MNIQGTRVTVVAGPYGSGKTEVAINLALSLARSGKRVLLADLDIVNPYFRSREKSRELQSAGVEVIANPAQCADADIPALSAQVFSLFHRPGTHGIIDLGGDAAGAKIMARFHPQLVHCESRFWFVLNANRPQCNRVPLALSQIKSIEHSLGVPLDGLVNNSHLCEKTCSETLRSGISFAQSVSRASGLPLVYHTMENRFIEHFEPCDLLFPINRYMKKAWE